MKLPVLIAPGENGYLVAEIPVLPGCISLGRTKEAALEHDREAIQGYLESLRKDGIPTPRDVELEEVAVPVS